MNGLTKTVLCSSTKIIKSTPKSLVSGSQNVVPEPAAQASPGTSYKCKFPSPVPDPLGPTLWGVRPAVPEWTSPPRDSDAG